jgi:hypothetical protein
MPTPLLINTAIHNKSAKLTFLFLLFPLFFFGQTLTGLWTGALHNDSSTVRKDQSFEIALTEYNGKVYGYSRSEFIVNDTLYYILKRVKGTIEGDICEVKDDEIISYNFRGKLDKGIKVTSTFRRNQNDSIWHLDGNWKTNTTKKYYSVTGKVSLESEKDLTASKLFPHLEELSLANDVVFYKDRTEAPPTVKVAKPEHLTEKYLPVTSVLTSSVDPVAIPAMSAATVKPADVTEVASSTNDSRAIKKAVSDLTKTESAAIPSSTQATVSLPGDPIIAEIKKVAPAEQQATITNTSVSATKDKPETKNVIAKDTNPVIVAAKNNTLPVASSVAENDLVKPVTVAKTNQSLTNNKPVVQEVKNNAKPVVNPAIVAPVLTVAEVNKQELAKSTDALAAAQPIKTADRSITEKEAVIAGRKSEFSQQINFKSDSLIISLYDNGEIDGDTVSVFMNGEVILSKQGLKSSAIKKTIYITPGQTEDFTLVMFAESLGKYPPNTGLLVIRDGEDVYNLRFSSDFQKNAGIVFRRKK